MDQPLELSDPPHHVAHLPSRYARTRVRSAPLSLRRNSCSCASDAEARGEDGDASSIASLATKPPPLSGGPSASGGDVSGALGIGSAEIPDAIDRLIIAFHQGLRGQMMIDDR